MLKKEDLLHIADISKIYISDSECDLYKKDLNDMVEFASAISKLSMSKSEKKAFSIDFLRDDVANQQYNADDMLSNAPERVDGYFVVSKVIE